MIHGPGFYSVLFKKQIIMEYKFRGKRKDNGKWAYGCLVSTSPDEAFILLGVTGHIKRDDYECYMVEVDPKTVGMWTGLKDEFGNEIYDGDILIGVQSEQGKVGTGYETYDDVYEKGGGFKAFGKALQDGYTKENNTLYQFMWCSPGSHGSRDRYYQLDHIEVVGNRIDNPDWQLTPLQRSSVTHTMEPNNKQQEEQHAAGEAVAAEAANAQESASQDTAMEVQDSEEVTEG